MKKESFEDEEVAEILNEYYVAIKVDREERPDIDHIYMTVCQLLTGRGGWPLTVFMTPEAKPFFTGTYFPKESRMGMPGLITLLENIHDMWEKNKDSLISSSENITAMLRGKDIGEDEGDSEDDRDGEDVKDGRDGKDSIDGKYSKVNKNDKGREVSKVDDGAVRAEVISTGTGARQRHDDFSFLYRSIIDNAYSGLKHSFDLQYGGFGIAPKFPSWQNLLTARGVSWQGTATEKLLIRGILTIMHFLCGDYWSYMKQVLNPII